MSTNFPTALDALTNPAATDVLTGHAAQHSNANDAIEALQAKVGVNSSAVATSLDYKVSALESSRELAANKGVAGGYASLDGAGKVPAAQLPSYVDDVLEYANLAGFPVTGEPGKIYVAEDTNKTYRWSGSAYVYITSGAVDSVAGKTGVVTLVKGDVGLANVDNTSDANKPVSTATQAALDLKANLSSPALSGTPTAPTAIVGTDTTQVATTAFVNAEIANDAAPKLHVGATGTAHGVATTSVAGFMSATDKTKLDGIATGATNTPLSSVAPSALGVAAAGTSTSAARADHVHAAQTSVTGNAGSATKLETVRTINGVSFDGTANITISATDSTARIASSEKGVPNGVATLDASGLVPSTQLPSYVDDVLEYANTAGFPVTGETAKIYVALDSNKVYRWSGSAYVEIMSSPGSTDVVTEGSTNLYFKESRVRNTVLSGISFLTNATVTAADSVLSAFGKIQKQITDHLANVSNPHSVTKAQVGLANVDDTSDANKPVSTAQQSALNLKADLSGANFTGPASVTVSSASPALKITQTGTGNALVVEDAASDATPFVVDQNGVVIAGGVNAAVGYGQLQSQTAGGFAGIYANFSPDANPVVLTLSKSRSSAIGGYASVVVNGDGIGRIQFAATDGSSGLVRAAQIEALVDGTPGTNDMPGRLIFSTTADGASSPTERMRISSDGGVSIGTTAAAGANTLRVANTLLATDRLEINGLGTGNRYAYIDLVGDDTYTDYGARLIRDNNGANAATQFVTRGTGDLAIKTIDAGAISLVTSNVERLRISSAGNLLQTASSAFVGMTIRNTFGSGAVTSHSFVDFQNELSTTTGSIINVHATDGASRIDFSATPAGARNYDRRVAIFQVFGTGNVLAINPNGGLGYGTGAGGTVTQATSKSTAVTLNRPCGQITTHNAALAAGAEVGFRFNNSVMTNADVLIVTPQGVLGTAYSTRVVIGTAGASIYVKNMTADSLSDAVVLNFVVIKGAVA